MAWLWWFLAGMVSTLAVAYLIAAACSLVAVAEAFGGWRRR